MRYHLKRLAFPLYLYSFALIGLAALISVVGKFLFVAMSPDPTITWIDYWLALRPELAFFALILFLTAWAYARRTRYLIALAVTVLYYLVVSATGYLLIAGMLPDAGVLRTAVFSWADAKLPIIDMVRTHWWLQLLIATPALLAATLSWRARHHPAPGFSRYRAQGAAIMLGVASLLSMLVPLASSMTGRFVSDNALASIIKGVLLEARPEGRFQGFAPIEFASAADMQAWRGDHPRPPNVVFFVIESLRYDYTGLSPQRDPQALPTPVIDGLIRNSLVSTSTRSVVPHSSKSLFNVFCSRVPVLQYKIVELVDDYPVQCLADSLGAAGYDTAFIQTALGIFESRIRLTRKLGYQTFYGGEDLGGQRLGFFASPDSRLLPGFLGWLDQRPDAVTPFHTTLFTSASHHPYIMPDDVASRARAMGWPVRTDQDRYSVLINEADRVLGELIAGLKQRGLWDNTVLVVMGDHGEGFGKHGVKQHDYNFFEEGLRVPVLIHGPGVRPGRMDGNTTLSDLLPTVLDLISVPYPANLFVGHSWLREDYPSTDAKEFACWVSATCAGAVQGTRKFVVQKIYDQDWKFDLVGDPDERRPLAVAAVEQPVVEGVRNWLIDHYWAGSVVGYDGFTSDNPQFGTRWVCPSGQYVCTNQKLSR